MRGCTHPRTISYAEHLRRGGEPVDPSPIGIIDSPTVGWFVCLDCRVLSNDRLELRAGTWPCLGEDDDGPLQMAMLV